MRIRSVLPIGAAIAVAAGGCDLVTDLGTRVIGIIGVVQEDAWHGASGHGESTYPYEGGPPISAPDTVAAGETFGVVVSTHGPNGCHRADGAEVSAGDTLVEIVPYDRVAGRNCTDAIVRPSRDVSLVFHEPGDAVIRVRGRVVVYSDGSQSEIMGSYDHAVVVLP